MHKNCKTLNDIINTKPPSEFLRDNEHKQWRESWVAAKFCEGLKWTKARVCIPPQDQGDDVFVEYDNKSFPFQIAEMAPRDPSVVNHLPSSTEDENGLISYEVYGSLSAQVTNLVQNLVQKKDKKNYTNQEKMNLLIYLNPPIMIDAEEDIDKPSLKEQVKSSKFKTISLYTYKEVIFIKGDISSLAQS